MLDPYSVLGVPSNASMDDIKKAYRKLSRMYHPDANVNNPNKEQAEEKFKQVQEAYNQILNERERGSSGYDSWYGRIRRRHRMAAMRRRSRCRRRPITSTASIFAKP